MTEPQDSPGSPQATPGDGDLYRVCEPVEPQVRPEFVKDGFIEEMGSCQEEPPVAVSTGLGDARKSEFTVAGSFGGTTRGYRVTALSRDKRVRVVCQCSESDWETLKPAFDRVIESLGRGKAER